MDFQRLPNELVLIIAGYLSACDIYTLAILYPRFYSLLFHVLRSAALHQECAKSALWWAVLNNDRTFARSILEHGEGIAVARIPDDPEVFGDLYSRGVAAWGYSRWFTRAFHRAPGVCDDATLDWIMAQGTCLLLKKDSMTERENGWFTNPLSYAIEKRRHALLKLSLRVGDREFPHKASGLMPNSLHILGNVAGLVDQQQVEVILDYIGTTHGPDIYQTALNTALMMSISGPGKGLETKMDGYTEMIKFLVRKGADVNMDMQLTRRALNPSTVYGSSRTRLSPLHKAVCHSSLEVVDVLLKNGADINAQCSQGYTPINEALGGYREDLGYHRESAMPRVKLLLKYGANIHIRDNKGGTVLMLAAVNGDDAMVKLLLQNGAAVGEAMYGSKGQTALHFAVVRLRSLSGIHRLIDYREATIGFETVIKLLLENGADPRVQGYGGRTTPSHGTTAGGRKDCENAQGGPKVRPYVSRLVREFWKGRTHSV